MGAITFRFTVFTPTYNRDHTLSRGYESLKSQTDKGFEWLIVDDGSSDGTAKMVGQWQEEGFRFVGNMRPVIASSFPTLISSRLKKSAGIFPYRYNTKIRGGVLKFLKKSPRPAVTGRIRSH